MKHPYFSHLSLGTVVRYATKSMTSLSDGFSRVDVFSLDEPWSNRKMCTFIERTFSDRYGGVRRCALCSTVTVAQKCHVLAAVPYR